MGGGEANEVSLLSSPRFGRRSGKVKKGCVIVGIKVELMNILKELQGIKRDDLVKIARMMNVKTTDQNHEDWIISKILLHDDEQIYRALKNLQAENLQKITSTMKRRKRVETDVGREAVERAITAIRMDYLMHTSKVASEIENIAMMMNGSKKGSIAGLRALCDSLVTLERTDLRPLHRAVHEVNILMRHDLCSGRIKGNVEEILKKMNETLVRSEGMKILEQKIRESYETGDWKTLKTLFRVLEERLKNGTDTEK